MQSSSLDDNRNNLTHDSNNSNNKKRKLMVDTHQHVLNDIAKLNQAWIRKRIQQEQQQMELGRQESSSNTTTTTTTTGLKKLSSITDNSRKKPTKRQSCHDRITNDDDIYDIQIRQQCRMKKSSLEQLYQLRKYRMALLAQIEMMKYTKVRHTNNNNNNNQSILTNHNNHNNTLFHEIQYEYKNYQQHRQLHEMTSNHDINSTTKDNHNHNTTPYHNDDTSVVPSKQNDSQLLTKLQQIRQSMCITAAYRLSGISIHLSSNNNTSDNNTNDDNTNTLLIQFDVGNISYQCLFDMVSLSYRQSNVSSSLPETHTETTTTTKTSDTVDVATEGNPMIFLRLVHHTLPTAVPITSIFQKCILPYHHHMIPKDCQYLMIPIGYDLSSNILNTTPSSWNDETIYSNVNHPSSLEQKKNMFIQQLQNITSQIYHVCHCLQIRKGVYDFLYVNIHSQSTTVDDPTTAASTQKLPYTIQTLECSDQQTYRMIQFHIHHRLSGIAHIMITLQYSMDVCRLKAHQPISVIITIIKDHKHTRNIKDRYNKHRYRHFGNNDDAIVSDIEDHNYDNDDNAHRHNEFIENATLLFRRLPIQSAIQKVIDIMSEY